MAELFDPTPPPAIERLARIEGQSNFLSLLAGIEAGPDTTQDMAALAFARTRGCIPEALEAHVAQSTMYRLPLMSVVWHAVLAEWKPKEKDWRWVQGAIADAFLLFRVGYCNPVKVRAKSFKVDEAAFGAMRKAAASIFNEIMCRAESEFRAALRSTRETTGCRHSERGEEERKSTYRMGNANYRATPLGYDDDGNPTGFDTRGIGINDRLGYDERNTRPGPVLTLHGAEAERWCRDHPAQHTLQAQQSTLAQPTAPSDR